MNQRHQPLLAAFLLVAAAGCTGQTVRAPAPVVPVGDARRGEYLTAIFACQECHTLRQPDGIHLDRKLLFTGGIPFKGAWGLVHTANVTVSARQFPAPVLESAIRGRLTFKFQMPTDLYSTMAADDMRDVVAYLRTLDPVPRPLPENRFEPGYQTPEPVPDGTVPERAPLPGTPERGRYLARLSICQDCHSPRAPDGRRPGEPMSAAAHYDQERLFGGGGLAFRFADGRWLIPPNLTPDPETGLGRWSEMSMPALALPATPRVASVPEVVVGVSVRRFWTGSAVDSLDEESPFGHPLGETLADPNSPEPADELVATARAGAVRAALARLSPRKRRIVHRHFGLAGEPATLVEIGAEMHLSPERVRGLKDEALRDLASELAAAG